MKKERKKSEEKRIEPKEIQQLTDAVTTALRFVFVFPIYIYIITSPSTFLNCFPPFSAFFSLQNSIHPFSFFFYSLENYIYFQDASLHLRFYSQGSHCCLIQTKLFDFSSITFIYLCISRLYVHSLVINH